MNVYNNLFIEKLNYELYNDVALFNLLSTTTATMKLICFPYAGGSGMLFKKLAEYVVSNIEVWSIEAPGHIYTSGKLEDDIDELCNRYINSLPKSLWSGNIALFGHSLGGYIACILASKLLEKKIANPILILSATPPPHLRGLKYQFSSLSPQELVPVLVSFNGLSKEWLNKSELLSFYLDTLYADFKMFENFIFPENIQGLETLILAGYEDSIFDSYLFFEWQCYFSKYQLEFITGGHLFIDEHPLHVARIINKFCNYS